MIKKLTHQMTIPQIFAAMTGTLCMLIDNIMIGQLINVDGISAYGYAVPLLIVITSAGLMMANGLIQRGRPPAAAGTQQSDTDHAVSSMLFR